MVVRALWKEKGGWGGVEGGSVRVWRGWGVVGGGQGVCVQKGLAVGSLNVYIPYCARKKEKGRREESALCACGLLLPCQKEQEQRPAGL